jgi:hypothetical protein
VSILNDYVRTNRNSTVLVIPSFSSVVGLHEASIKGRWEFGSKPGALLVIAGPRKSYIPRDIILDKLAAVPLLKEKALVTGVITCPAYSLYLSSASECSKNADFQLTDCSYR